MWLNMWSVTNSQKCSKRRYLPCAFSRSFPFFFSSPSWWRFTSATVPTGCGTTVPPRTDMVPSASSTSSLWSLAAVLWYFFSPACQRISGELTMWPTTSLWEPWRCWASFAPAIFTLSRQLHFRAKAVGWVAGWSTCLLDCSRLSCTSTVWSVTGLNAAVSSRRRRIRCATFVERTHRSTHETENRSAHYHVGRAVFYIEKGAHRSARPTGFRHWLAVWTALYRTACK